MSDENDEIDSAPGWDAIDAALYPIYGDREPHHYGTIVPYALGGPDPIQGISAYRNAEPFPHWHFVTYGFSELWKKESSDPDVSGYGFELTFRPTCSPDEETPPVWALNFLQNLGRYVFETGHGFGIGHTLPLNGPIRAESSTRIHAAALAADSQLPPIMTPNGRVEFLQVVGLTMDELDAISSWDAAAFLELRSQNDPILLTYLDRHSWMEDDSFATEVDRRSRQEGSSCAWLNLVLECETDTVPVQIHIQSIAAEDFGSRLLGRLLFGRELVLNGDDGTVVFQPGEKSSWRLVEGALTVTLQDDDVVAFADSLEPHAGVYPIAGVEDEVHLHVLKTEIKDRDGNIVEIVE
jgi:hypothetical protein